MKINADQIVSISIHPKVKDVSYSWRQRVDGSFFIRSQPEGFYKYPSKFVGANPRLNNRYVEDGVVYYRPYIKINLSNGDCHIRYFLREKSMEEYVSELTKDRLFIEVN